MEQNNQRDRDGPQPVDIGTLLQRLSPARHTLPPGQVPQSRKEKQAVR
jgi:hypothetical protein